MRAEERRGQKQKKDKAEEVASEAEEEGCTPEPDGHDGAKQPAGAEGEGQAEEDRHRQPRQPLILHLLQQPQNPLHARAHTHAHAGTHAVTVDAVYTR